MVDGSAQVQLDPDFAVLVQCDGYHVFLTPEADSKGLWVTDRSPTHFTVREQQGGTSSLTFSYRVVAKRKDIEVRRLEQVKLLQPEDVLAGPIDQEPQRPAIPELPESPELADWSAALKTLDIPEIPKAQP